MPPKQDCIKTRFLCSRPTQRTTPDAINTARALAQHIGSRVIELDAERHDEIVAAVSHLPYIVASNLAGTVESLPEGTPWCGRLHPAAFAIRRGLAASDVQMMLDILLTNSENVAHLMRSYFAPFRRIGRRHLRWGRNDAARDIGARGTGATQLAN